MSALRPLPPQRSRWILFLLLGVGTFLLMRMLAFYAGQWHRQITYSEFYRLIQENPKTGQITEAKLLDDRVEGRLKNGTGFSVYLPPRDEEILKLLRENVPDLDVQPPQAGFVGILVALSPWIIFLVIMWFVMRSAQGGGRLLSFGKSRARLISPETHTRVTFDDVAGIDEAKEELREIIEFLKDPKRFQRLGGKIPKGVLLIGLPGTGKTLLAKAVAGEANVPFYSISGSDFVEMFVGVGASRVRDLFEQARRNARQGGKGAIVFIDEIDAVGRQRFAGIGGGHDEREQTLNALLVEMDGFDTQEGTILVAATNRPDVLDPALLRPGRFDRQVVISLPDIVGREAILKVHTRKIKLGKEVDLKSVARQTPGFSGADLANLANEAALLAARLNKDVVGVVEFEKSIERVIAGPERKTRVLNEKEKRITAFHESGHALVALITPETDPLHKVSIIPRGAHALGYTMQLPIEDRYTMSKGELVARMTVMMGGRVAEELVFNEITTGAQNDLETATEMARRMVCEFGMSERLGSLTYGKRERQMFLGRDLFEERNYSEQTAVLIDEEVRRLIDTAHERARQTLTAHRAQLDLLAQTLLEKEVLDGEEVKRLVGPVAASAAPEPAPPSGNNRTTA
ncbi:MAG: ATP-dependent metallopeptidase FtsH/Yme1/Tma family protein [Candidatus Omnitrophica bacterium]|nr:ATP-dependent metallopeptidase FtsH/Yme1/Tma family protein [Candidatus Omnitrophota bacterium]